MPAHRSTLRHALNNALKPRATDGILVAQGRRRKFSDDGPFSLHETLGPWNDGMWLVRSWLRIQDPKVGDGHMLPGGVTEGTRVLLHGVWKGFAICSTSLHRPFGPD
ncbi:hypothetical protein SVAN01_07623 [Stagonosporopsis vannaccii]|nr:hypothetical protein SVAN01_07623 [Stagonosporopsis vannaccii]